MSLWGPAQESEQAESLPLAAKLGQSGVVEELLARGEDVDTRDDWGATALHWAARHDSTKAVQSLLLHKVTCECCSWN